MELKKNFIPLRNKIEAGADLVRTITSWYKLYVNIFSHPWPIIWVTLHCLSILRTGFFQPWGLFYFLFQFVPGEVCMFPGFQWCGQPINQTTSIHGRPSKQFVHYFQPVIPCCGLYVLSLLTPDVLCVRHLPRWHVISLNQPKGFNYTGLLAASRFRKKNFPDPFLTKLI